MSVRLRPYQDEAVDAVLADLLGGVRRPAVVLPTGSGKSLVIASLAQRWLDTNPGRVVVLAHREELVNQNAGKLAALAPGLDVGIVKAARDETTARVVVASVQTLAREDRRERISDVSLVIADEAHLYLAPTWRAVLDHFEAPAVGLTATMARGDGGRLGLVWDKISYERSILWMIRRGYLCDVEGLRIDVPDLDLSGLTKSNGDFSDAAIADALGESVAPAVAAKAYREHAADMPGILFAPTVASAHDFTDALAGEGFEARTVWGAMPAADRAGTLAAYEAGDVQVMSSVGVLEIGFDSPRAQCAVMARPTASSPSYIQRVGRVLRPYPGKVKALVLDLVGSTGRHELVTLASLGGDARVALKSGQSLLEALDAEQASQDQADAVRVAAGYTGPLEAVAVDLFGGSRQAWLRTKAGHWFLPAGERLLVLLPAAGGACWDVAWFVAHGSGGGWIERGLPDLGYAMAAAEGAVTADEEMYAAKARAWRKKKASVKQVEYAKRLRVYVDGMESWRAGAVGDVLSVESASRRIDGAVRRAS